MMRITGLALALLVAAIAAPHGRAAWGWPPPGYCATGIRCCDGAYYRGLRQVHRDKRGGACNGCCAATQPTAIPTSSSGSPPATTSHAEPVPMLAPIK